jgi:hypothetical protein
MAMYRQADALLRCSTQSGQLLIAWHKPPISVADALATKTVNSHSQIHNHAQQQSSSWEARCLSCHVRERCCRKKRKANLSEGREDLNLYYCSRRPAATPDNPEHRMVTQLCSWLSSRTGAWLLVFPNPEGPPLLVSRVN